jgi:hypothetical protein
MDHSAVASGERAEPAVGHDLLRFLIAWQIDFVCLGRYL